MPSVVYCGRQPGRCRPGGTGNRRHLPAAGETSAHGNDAERYHALSPRFWIVTKFPNYVIACRPDTAPLQVVAVLHGNRGLKEVLERRSV